MRKFVIMIAVLGLMNSGCAWLGFGDDESSASQTEEYSAASEQSATASPAEATPETSAKEVKAAKGATKSGAKGAKSETQIKSELDRMGHKLAAQSARTLLPNKANKEVKQSGGEWVASYIDVNPDAVTTEMRQGAKGQYIGLIRYEEEFMECRGATRQAALSAPCVRVKTRRLTEMIHYDGGQWQD